MTSKHLALALGAVLFTVINLLVLAANWSMTAHAKVAGMDFSRLEVDEDFRRAIRDVADGSILLAAEQRLSNRSRGSR
jgi:hypothetical protein